MTKTIDVEFYLAIDGDKCWSVAQNQSDAMDNMCEDEAIVVYKITATVPVPKSTDIQLTLSPAGTPTLTQESAKLKLPE